MAWYVENGRLTHDDLPAPAEPMFIEPYPPGFWYTADGALTHAQLPEVFQFGAFLNCTKLKKAVIPESVKSIGEYAFSNTALTSVKIAGDCFYYDTSFPDGCEISYYSDYGEYTGTVPVQFRSDGSYLSDWSIKGNTVQNGTPSPSSPVSVNGVGESETIGEYSGQYKIPILCGNQTTNIYLGETQSTRAVKKLVLTGEENWEQQSGQTADYFRISNMAALPSKVFCTHFLSPDENINYASTVTGIKMQQSSSYGVILACRPPNVTGLANFKSFLATQYANGTPVTVWYVLATPETATINEPLMKIGDYADSIDKAGAGVNIPTLDGINTLSVGTSVQPSEVYIKYNI